MGPWALGPWGGPAVRNMRLREQRLMRFRVRGRVRVRWFSVGHLGPGPLGGLSCKEYEV